MPELKPLPKPRIEQIRQHLDEGWFQVKGEAAVRELLEEVERLEEMVAEYRLLFHS